MQTSYEDLARQDVSLPFTPSRFAMTRRPIDIGAVDIATIGALPSCLDMLIKLPGGEVVLPEPYASDKGVADFLQQSLAKEDDLLPGWREHYHLYLTYDRRQVQSGRSHRNGGWHFDGMQGARFGIKIPVCHQYVVSTHLPTEYVDVPTDATGLDENKHNWFLALGSQVAEDAEIIKAVPGQINLMTAYQLHRSPIAEEHEAGWRTFIRLDVSLKQQDRLGNSINPILPAPWEFVERKLPEGLGVPVRDSNWDGAEKFSPKVTPEYVERNRLLSEAENAKHADMLVAPLIAMIEKSSGAPVQQEIADRISSLSLRGVQAVVLASTETENWATPARLAELLDRLEGDAINVRPRCATGKELYAAFAQQDPFEHVIHGAVQRPMNNPSEQNPLLEEAWRDAAKPRKTD